MYDFNWHQQHGFKTRASAEVVVDIMGEFLDFHSVLDVGCGDGRWLDVCRSKGVQSISGVDGPWTDATQMLIPAENVTIKDLSTPFNLDRRFDLVLCLEVAEHVEKQFAGIFVDNLVRHSDVILFGAAIPYQGGFRHVNEQWQSYWSGLFNDRGFKPFDPIRSQIWDNPDVHFWYKQNMLLYIKADRHDIELKLSSYMMDKKVQQLPIDVIYPEKYEAAASYSQIAFLPLMKNLPRQSIQKLSSILQRKT